MYLAMIPCHLTFDAFKVKGMRLGREVFLFTCFILSALYSDCIYCEYLLHDRF